MGEDVLLRKRGSASICAEMSLAYRAAIAPVGHSVVNAVGSDAIDGAPHSQLASVDFAVLPIVKKLQVGATSNEVAHHAPIPRASRPDGCRLSISQGHERAGLLRAKTQYEMNKLYAFENPLYL
eukprot:6208829-Pleurochrysis_carterae.AAC.1